MIGKTIYEKQIEWCIAQHRNANHYYEKYLPYEFHLRMVVQVCKDFSHLIKMIPAEPIVCEMASWGHDLIEDARVSYNDCVKILGKPAADIIYALTNEKGRNRAERANEKYYEGIRNTDGAAYVKLCDRIANVQFGKMTKSRMVEMYKAENQKFIINILGVSSMELVEKHSLNEMVAYLEKLFQD